METDGDDVEVGFKWLDVLLGFWLFLGIYFVLAWLSQPRLQFFENDFKQNKEEDEQTDSDECRPDNKIIDIDGCNRICRYKQKLFEKILFILAYKGSWQGIFFKKWDYDELIEVDFFFFLLLLFLFW